MRQINTTSSTIILRADRVMSDVTVYAKQYDSQSRFINIDLRDDGGRIYGTNIIQLNALRPGCRYSYVRGEQDENGIIHFELTSQILALPGNVLCDVSLFDYSAPETVFEYGTGAKKEFAIMRRFYKINSVTVGGTSTLDYEYDSKSGVIAFTEAPGADMRIDITGEGIQLLTSALFTIAVEKSCYDDQAIAASDEFLTVSSEILKAQDILYDAEQKLTNITDMTASVKKISPDADPTVTRTGGHDGEPYNFEFGLPLGKAEFPYTDKLIKGLGDGEATAAVPGVDYVLPTQLPSKTSELTNDGDGASPFATAAQLANVGDKFYTHTQLAAADTWSIEHNLGKFPAVTVVDSGGSTVIGEIDYIDENNLTITFQSAFGGRAYLN